MTQSVDGLLIEGRNQLNRDQLEEAVKSFRLAAELDPFSAPAFTGWAQALMRQKRYQQAIWKLQAATKAQPDFLPAYLAAGELLTSQERYQESLAWFEKATKVKADSANAWKGAAFAFEKLNRPASAIEHYRRVIELEPLLTDARIREAMLLFQLRRPEAVGSYEDIIKLEERAPKAVDDSVAIQARMGLSAAYLTSRQYARAYVRARQGLDMISRLAKTSDKSSEIARALEAPMYVYLGLSAVAVKQYGEAIEHFIAAEAAETLALSLMASQFRISTLAQLGRYHDTWSTVDSLLERHKEIAAATGPLNSEVAVILGNLCAYKSQYKDAERIYRRAPTEDPKILVPLARLFLVRADEEREDQHMWRAKAREIFLQASTMLDESGDDNAERHAALGSLFVAFGDDKRAEGHLMRARDLDPEEAVTYANLGVVYLRLESPRKALQYYRYAIDRDSDNVGYQVGLAETYLSMKMLGEAERVYLQVLSSAPGNFAARLGLGNTFYTQAEDGEADRCIAAIEQYNRAHRDMFDGNSSMWPNDSAEAQVLYARGCAYVQAYNSRFKRRESRFGFGVQSSLTLAKRDFSRAKKLGHAEAARALQVVVERDKLIRARELPPIIVTMISVLLLALVQVAFFGSFLTAKLTPTQYTTLTLGLLAFTIAGVSLPELLKLKVAGVAIEKTASEIQLAALEIGAIKPQPTAVHGYESAIPEPSPEETGKVTPEEMSGPAKGAKDAATGSERLRKAE